jgi:hypothetical protein
MRIHENSLRKICPYLSVETHSGNKSGVVLEAPMVSAGPATLDIWGVHAWMMPKLTKRCSCYPSIFLGMVTKNNTFLRRPDIVNMEIYHHLPLLVGGFNHLEKYERQWEGLSHIL